MRGPALFAAGYALLLWAIAFGLRRRAAGGAKATWVHEEGATFARVIALVPLAVADAVLVGAACFSRDAHSVLLLGAIFAGVTRTGWREVTALHLS